MLIFKTIKILYKTTANFVLNSTFKQSISTQNMSKMIKNTIHKKWIDFNALVLLKEYRVGVKL